MFNKIILAISVAFISTISYAHNNPAESSTCYIFKNNKLASKGKCLIESGGGAGGSWTNITFNKKQYSYETTQEEDMNPTKEYNRDAKTFKKIKVTSHTATPFLLCNHYTPTDLCYLSK